MTEPRTDGPGLLSEDHSEIALVDDGRREVWTRKARPQYLCPKCGVWHQPWSVIYDRHLALRLAAVAALRKDG